MRLLPVIFSYIISTTALPANCAVRANQATAHTNTTQPTQSFISEEAGFSINLPGSPPRRSGKSNHTDYYEYTWPTNLGTYTVRYMDSDRPLGNNLSNNMTLMKLREAFIAQQGSRPERDHEITLGDYPGHEIVFNDAKGILIQRFYVAGKRIYDVSAYLPDQIRPARTRAEAALDSFQLINAPTVVLGEADRMIKSLREKGELTFGKCAGDESACVPLKGNDGDGISSGMKAGSVVAGKVISKPAPEYPEIAKAARAAGVVLVLVVVDEEGLVMAAQATMGHPLLRDVAVKAARGAKFTPTLFDGKPVKVTGLISYAFILQ